MRIKKERRERVKKREMKSNMGGDGGSCSRKQSGDAAMSMPLI